MMPFGVISLFGHTLSIDKVRFEDRFCGSKKGRIEGDGWTYSRHAMHIVAALADCRMALIGTGWTISYLVSTNRYRNHSHFVEAPFLVL